ncbi:MAG: recombinase family protein [Clostridia bacterium]|nr:recombinase family protein [Clostridia bacterium]
MDIAAYCRVSTDKDEQLDSLEHQKEFFTEFAVKNGHRLVRLYADEGITGTSLKKRGEFQRLMQDAGSGLFQMVVVKDISRFARNTVDFLQSIRTLKSLGINTLFLTANMESLGESEFILTVFSALAQEESVNLSKRVKFGKKINAQKGRVPQRIFGYDRIDNFTLQINPKEAEVVRAIYGLYLEGGLGCRAISLELRRLGYKTKFDCEWDPRGVRRVLTNPIYCGEYINNKYEIKDCLEGKQVRIPAEQHFHHNRPEWAIVSKEIFDRAQIRLKERREKYDPAVPRIDGRQSETHLFSTLIRCEHCGRSFYQKHYTYRNTRYYWKCQTNDQFSAKACDNRVTITEGDLLEEIRGYLSSMIQDKDRFVQEIIAELEKGRQKPRKAVSQVDLQRRIKQLRAKKEKYQEMYAADVMAMGELKEKSSYINKEIQALRAQLKQISVLDHAEKVSRDQIHLYTKEIEAFFALENITNGDLRKIISRMVVNRNGEIKIYLRDASDVTSA